MCEREKQRSCHLWNFFPRHHRLVLFVISRQSSRREGNSHVLPPYNVVQRHFLSLSAILTLSIFRTRERKRERKIPFEEKNYNFKVRRENQVSRTENFEPLKLATEEVKLIVSENKKDLSAKKKKLEKKL